MADLRQDRKLCRSRLRFLLNDPSNRVLRKDGTLEKTAETKKPRETVKRLWGKKGNIIGLIIKKTARNR